MRVRRAAAGLALAALILLVVAEFTTVFEVTVGSLEVVKRSSTAGANHGYALVLVAVAAAVLTLLALPGARAPSAALVALGCAVLAIALAIDLPDTRGSGRLPESLAYDDARARAGAGLAIEIAGGALLIAAGGLLLAAARSSGGAGGGAGGGGGGGAPRAGRRRSGRSPTSA